MRAMPGAGLVQREFRQISRFEQLEVLLNRAFHGPVHLDPSIQELAQGAPPDAANNHGIHRVSSQGTQGLTLPMLVPHIQINSRFHRVGLCVDHNKTAG
jgi:hypothetical protein